MRADVNKYKHDIYIYHMPTVDPSRILIITNKHLMLIKRDDAKVIWSEKITSTSTLILNMLTGLIDIKPDVGESNGEVTFYTRQGEPTRRIVNLEIDKIRAMTNALKTVTVQ